MNIEKLALKKLELEIGRDLLIIQLEKYLHDSPPLTTNQQKTIANYIFFDCTKINQRCKQAIFKINSGRYKGKFISFDIGSGNGSG